MIMDLNIHGLKLDAGAGSRGGHVIGYRNGKPIYASANGNASQKLHAVMKAHQWHTSGKGEGRPHETDRSYGHKAHDTDAGSHAVYTTPAGKWSHVFEHKNGTKKVASGTGHESLNKHLSAFHGKE